MIKDPKTDPIPAPDPATPTVAAPAPMNLAAESISRLAAEVVRVRLAKGALKIIENQYQLWETLKSTNFKITCMAATAGRFHMAMMVFLGELTATIRARLAILELDFVGFK